MKARTITIKGVTYLRVPFSGNFPRLFIDYATVSKLNIDFKCHSIGYFDIYTGMSDENLELLCGYLNDNYKTLKTIL